MNTKRKLLRIFLSSPSDVGPQRDVARQVVLAMNQDPLVAPRFIIEVVAWDTAGAWVPLGGDETPQASINRYLPRPHECDLTIVLLWSRLGTPMPPDWTDRAGRRIASGTVWELEDARSAGSPVWIYQLTKTPQASLDAPHLEDLITQWQAVKTFVGQAKAPDGSLRFGVHTFENDEQLHELLLAHLRHFVAGLLHAASESDVASAAAAAAAEAASAVVALPSVKPLSAALKLHDLRKFPIGPMIKDIQVRALALAVAEANERIPPHSLFADINAALAKAAEPGTEPMRLATVMFTTTLGSNFFWQDVLHWASIQGPRVLAATLSIVQPERLDTTARDEYDQLVRRLFHYV